jgi:hypothetical protein
LSRIRSPVTSRSNWAKERSTFSVSRPIDEVVLNCWVTETKETAGIEDFDDLGEVGERAGEPVHLVDHDHVDPPCPHIAQEPFDRRALHGAPGIAAMVIKTGEDFCTQSP